MLSRDDARSRTIERLSVHLLATGLGQTSLRQLAAAAGTSDRMLLYYFADKSEVLQATLAAIAQGMNEQLAVAMPEDAALQPAELIGRALAITSSGAFRPYMHLWIEIVAAAARQEEPFAGIAKAISSGFLHWIEVRLAPDITVDRKHMAALVFSIIDGFTLLGLCDSTSRPEDLVAALHGLTGQNP